MLYLWTGIEVVYLIRFPSTFHGRVSILPFLFYYSFGGVVVWMKRSSDVDGVESRDGAVQLKNGESCE